MRIRARVDDNHAAIVEGLRRCGASVRSTAAIGKGFPDIVVGYRGKNYLIEIKDGAKVASKRKLTPDEEKFFHDWRGQVDIAESLEDALRIIGGLVDI